MVFSLAQGLDDLLPQLHRFERRDAGLDVARQVAHRRNDVRDDRRCGDPRLVDGMMERHHRSVGVAEYGVPIETQCLGQERNVRRHLRERPGLAGGLGGSPLGPLIDEHEQEPIGEAVQVVTPHVMVGSWPAMEADQRRPGPALFDEERCVADVHEPSCDRC